MRIAIALIVLLSASILSAATFTVSNTNVTGTGSLQQALLDANAATGPDTIVFAIPGDGPHVISPTPAEPLPWLTNSTTIDGYTQPGAAPNSLTNGFNAVIKIQLDGLTAGSFSHGLTIFGSNNTVRGLSITRFGTTSSDGISVDANADNNTIEGNLIGLNPSGSSIDHGNARNGITISSASGNLIGGPTPAARNIISDNSQYGIYIQGGGRASNNIVQGNAIGLAINGTRDGNSSGGIILLGVPRTTIGGATSGAGNVISGNTGSGIMLQFAGATNNLIQGNLIGPDYTGTLSRNNTINGIWLLDASFNTIGGTNPGAGNLIAFNGIHAVRIDSASGNQLRGNTLVSNIVAGVFITSGTNNAIRANSIFGNGPLEIDFEPEGFSNFNDPQDVDTGPNFSQNYPILTNAVFTRTNVIIQGNLQSAPGTAYELDFFANINCQFTGYGEGQFFLGSALVTTDSNGDAFFSASLPGVPPGLVFAVVFAATATDPFGNTSEFSPCLNATASIPHATFTVTNTNDAGPGSLRQALLDVNEQYGSDRIIFNIPGGGVQTIFPLSALPTPLDPVFIDGYTQPGTVPNSLTNGNNSALMIRLDGRNAGTPGADGLHFNTSSNTVRGLIIVHFSGDGIELAGGQGNTIQDVRVGSDTATPSPNSFVVPAAEPCGDGGNGEDGIRVTGSAFVRLVDAAITCNGDNGLAIEDCFGAQVENCSSTHNGGDGYLCAADNVTFTRCYASSNDDGFQITGNNNLVRNSIAEYSADDGWTINGNTNVVDNCSAGTINGNAVSVESGTGNRCFLIEVNEIGNSIIGISAGANGGQPPPTDVSAGTGPSAARIKGTISGAISGTYTVTVMVNKTNDSSPNRFVRVATFNVSKSSTNSVSFNQVINPNPAIEEGDTVLVYITGPAGSSAAVFATGVPDTLPDVRIMILPFPFARVGEIVEATVQINNEPFAPALNVRSTVNVATSVGDGRIVGIIPPPGATVTGPVDGRFTIDHGPMQPGGQTSYSVRIAAFSSFTLIANAVMVGQTDANPANNGFAQTGSLSSTGIPSDKNVTVADTTSAGDSLHPISTFTGELFEPLSPDLDLGGPMRLAFSRYYASFLQRLGRSGSLGHNWRHTHEWTLRDRGTSVEIITAHGRLITFTNLAGTYSLILRRDIPFQLNTNGGNFILADPRSQRLYTFDTSGRLTRIDDGRGNAFSLTYTNTLLTSVTDGLGRALTFQYSPTGLLTNVSDGRRSAAFSQTASNLTTARDPLGFVTTYDYYSTNTIRGLMLSATRPEGNVPFRQTFDSTGRVATQMVAVANTHALTYVGNLVTLRSPLGIFRRDVHTARGELLAFVDENRGLIGMDYNTNGQRIAVVDRANNLTRLAYHGPSGYISALTNTDGTVTTFTYTNRTIAGTTFFDLAQVTYPDGTSERFAYDTNGNILARVDRAGKTFTFTYNSRGQVLTAENPLGGVTTFTYHPNGALASRDDTDTGTTAFFVDAFSRLTNIVHPDGTSISATYNANDRLTSLTDGRTNTYTFAYDDNGNLTSVTDPLSNTAEFVYDTGDRRIRRIDRLGQTAAVAYDPLEHVVALTNRNGHVTQFSYSITRDLFGIVDSGNQLWVYSEIEALPFSFTNPLGQTRRIRRDARGYTVALSNPLNQTNLLGRDSLGRVTHVIDPLLRTNRFSYDQRGLLTNSATPAIGHSGYGRNDLGLLSRIIDLNGSQWHFTHTPMGRLLSTRDPLGRTNQFAYDSRGRRAGTVFANGTAVSNSFDAAGNQTRRLYSDGTDLQYGFDPRNRLVSADSLTRAYDANGRLTNTISSGVSFGAAYDPGGRLANVLFNAGAFDVAYTYDSRNRLVSVRDSLTGTQLDFAYDNAGRLTNTSRPNGINSTYTYDAAGRLTRIQEGTFVDLQYTLDPAAQITNLNYTVPLDPTNGLGNSTLNWTYDPAHQISSPGYSYDARGRLTNAPGKSFRYDAASRLTQINSATLAYNGLNDIVTRSEAGTTIRYLYNHALGMRPIVAEKNDSTGQILRYYIWSPGGTLLYMIDAENGNAVRHFHFDRVGSTLALTDSAGAVTDSYAYTPYGELLGRTGSSAQPFLFVGRYGVRSEPAAALYHMRARYYDPASARFLTRDPVWPVLRQPKSLDPYQYALGDPTRFIDPLGLQSYPADLVPRASATTGLAGLEERLSLELNSTGEDDPVNQATVDALRKQIDAERKRSSMRFTEFITDAGTSQEGASADGTHVNPRSGLYVTGIVDRHSAPRASAAGTIHSLLIHDNADDGVRLGMRDYGLGFLSSLVNHNATGEGPGDTRPNTIEDTLIINDSSLLHGCEPDGSWSVDENGWSGFCAPGRNVIYSYGLESDDVSANDRAGIWVGDHGDAWTGNNPWRTSE